MKYFHIFTTAILISDFALAMYSLLTGSYFVCGVFVLAAHLLLRNAWVYHVRSWWIRSNIDLNRCAGYSQMMLRCWVWDISPLAWRRN